jgi:hypothetical protein
MSPSPKQAPRLGDIPGPADLARRVDRLDSIERRLGRIEGKLDALVAASLQQKKAERR